VLPAGLRIVRHDKRGHGLSDAGGQPADRQSDHNHWTRRRHLAPL
jgi:protocatechuate 3,4-dioxygenase, beta subunit